MKRVSVQRGLVALSSATLMAALPACSGPQQKEHSPTGGVVVATQGAPAGLDFTSIGGAAAPQALMGNVYETLVRIDASGTPQPWLAHAWQRSADGLRYEFALRKDVTFSNGKAFDAHDAAFSIDYVRNHWTNGLKSQMDPVLHARALDAHTLEVVLREPDEHWLWTLGTLTGAMMTPESIPRLANDPLGTGPYTLASFELGEAIRFNARADYWGKPPHSDAMIRYFSDAVAAVNALRTGEADVVWDMQAPQLLGALPEAIDVAVGTTNGEVVFSMNNRVAPFDDPTVRQAVAFAIDRDAINDVVYGGLGTDTGGAPVPPTDPWYTGKNYYPHNPQRARELLAGRSPEITIKVPSRLYAQTAAELIFSQLRDVGFIVHLETVEFPAVWLQDVHKNHNYQASIISHVEPRDMPVMFGSPEHYFGYNSAATRTMLAQGDLSGAVDQIMADVGALTLVNAPNIVLFAPGVSGLNPNVVTAALPLQDVEKRGV